MPTSDNPPKDMTPAEEARLARLYRAQNKTDELSSSPTDLDDLIRATAKESVAPSASDYRGQAQRYGWATAAALVLTTALFLAVPNSDPDYAISEVVNKAPHETQRSPARQVTAPASPAPAISDTSYGEGRAALEAAKPEREIAVDEMARRMRTAEPAQPNLQSAPAPAAPAPAAPAPAPPQSAGFEQRAALGKAQPQPPSSLTEQTRADYSALADTDAMIEPSLAGRLTKKRIDAAESADSPATASLIRPGDCEFFEVGPIDRLCALQGNYLLIPRQPSACGVFKLDQTTDKKSERPIPEQDSDTSRFIYSLNKHTYALSCENGSWQVQSLARGR